MSGWPVKVDYIDFEDIREQELSDYDVIINAGFAGSAWSGGEQWNDSRVLEKLGEGSADACNVAYELTFFVMGLACAVYVLGIKKQKLTVKQEAPKYTGALFETVGQFFYIYALADTEHVAFAAPIISSYCVASVIWSRLFLKEKLSLKHYMSIGLVVVGIVIMGILDI